MGKPTAAVVLYQAEQARFERSEHRVNHAFDLTKCEIVDPKVTIVEPDGKHVHDWNVMGALESAAVELTITGASTIKLVCEDPKFELLNHPFFAKWMFKKEDVSKSSAKTFSRRSITDSSKSGRYGEEDEEEWILPQRPIDFNLDGIWFRLMGFRVTESKLELSFEDRVAAQLREEVGEAIIRERGKVTRAGFVHELVTAASRHQKVNIGAYIPEEKAAQPIAVTTLAETATDLKESSGKNLGPSDGITVKGAPATTSQLKILNEALEEAVELKAHFKAQVAMLQALCVESEAGKLSPNYFQLEPGNLTTYGTTIQDQVQGFLVNGYSGNGGAIQMETGNTHYNTSEMAQAVQESGAGKATSGNGDYGPSKAEAEHMVRVYGVTASTEGLTGPVTPGVYSFSRGPRETTWDCIQRLASEVSWFAFVRNNALWYVSGEYLLTEQKVKMEVERGKNGVDWVEPDVSIGARDGIATIKVSGRASLWAAQPGELCSVKGVGPANGNWVVSNVSLDILDRSDAITVTLEKTLPPRLEPAASGGVTEAEEEGKPGSSKVEGYVNPFAKIQNLTPERVDMGVDFAGSGWIVAMGDGIVYCSEHAPGWEDGWFLGYTLTSGPYAGKHIYHAENITSEKKVGEPVKAGEPIAYLHPASPNSESGWGGGGPQETLAASLGQVTGKGDVEMSAAGVSFNNLLGKLGAKQGVENASVPVKGKMPAGYP